MWDHEKTKAKNNRDRRRRNLTQKHRKYIQQHHGRKLSKPKERYAYEETRNLQNTK